MAMVRKQIYLDKPTDDRLKREAKRRGVSQASLIRERLAVADAPSKIPNDAARTQLLKRLKRVQSEARKYELPSGWAFNREELYEERLERQFPRRH